MLVPSPPVLLSDLHDTQVSNGVEIELALELKLGFGGTPDEGSSWSRPSVSVVPGLQPLTAGVLLHY